MIKEVVEKNGVFKGKLFAIKKGKWVDAVFNRKGDTLNITVSFALDLTLKFKTIKNE